MVSLIANPSVHKGKNQTNGALLSGSSQTKILNERTNCLRELLHERLNCLHEQLNCLNERLNCLRERVA